MSKHTLLDNSRCMRCERSKRKQSRCSSVATKLSATILLSEPTNNHALSLAKDESNDASTNEFILLTSTEEFYYHKNCLHQKQLRVTDGYNHCNLPKVLGFCVQPSQDN